MNQLLSYLGGGLWIIPLLTLAGSAIFGFLCYKSSTSGSVVYNQDGSKTESSKNKLNTGYLIFSLALLIATVVEVLLMRSDR